MLQEQNFKYRLLPHPRLVFQLQYQMLEIPHREVHTPTIQRMIYQLKRL